MTLQAQSEGRDAKGGQHVTPSYRTGRTRGHGVVPQGGHPTASPSCSVQAETSAETMAETAAWVTTSPHQ